MFSKGTEGEKAREEREEEEGGGEDMVFVVVQCVQVGGPVVGPRKERFGAGTICQLALVRRYNSGERRLANERTSNAGAVFVS